MTNVISLRKVAAKSAQAWSKRSLCCQPTKSEKGLSALIAPAHAAELESLRDKRLAGRLDDAGRDRKSLLPPREASHSRLVSTKVRELLIELFLLRVLPCELAQRAKTFSTPSGSSSSIHRYVANRSRASRARPGKC